MEWPLEPLMGVMGGGSSNVEGIEGRVDGDEGSVVRRGDPSTQSLRTKLQCI